MPRQKKSRKSTLEEHVPTQREVAAIQNLLPHFKNAPPRLKIVEGVIQYDHPNQRIGQMLFMDVLGITSMPLLNGILQQLVSAASTRDGFNEQRLDFATSHLIAIKPRDEIELMLAMQMFEIHMATMLVSGSLRDAENLVWFDAYERTLNKLARTYATQVDTLKRYRSSGEQKVTVQHVSVNEGGQAIVGSFDRPAVKDQQDPPTQTSPLLLENTATAPMPLLKDKQPEVVPVKRRKT